MKEPKLEKKHKKLSPEERNRIRNAIYKHSGIPYGDIVNMFDNDLIE